MLEKTSTPINTSKHITHITHITHSNSKTDIDPIKVELDKLTKNKHILVFSGFSQLGYRDIPSLEKALNEIISNAIQDHGINHLCVAAGATSEGIGRVYEIAKSWNIATLGIVSEQAKSNASSTAKNCDEVIYVPDPTGSWKTLDNEGKSYMVYVATKKESISRTGEFLAFGGGKITLSELNDAETLNIKPRVFPEFAPCPTQLALRRLKQPNEDATPVRTAYLLTEH